FVNNVVGFMVCQSLMGRSEAVASSLLITMHDAVSHTRKRSSSTQEAWLHHIMPPNLDNYISTSDNARFDSVETIEADPDTKNQGVEPATEPHEGVRITSIPPENK
ncbi:hypothetical protein Tco_1117072, partial [Tanacetum coccineum]